MKLTAANFINRTKRVIRFSFIIFSFSFLASCSVQKQIARSAQQHVIQDSSLLTAHVGISIYDQQTGKYLYNYQADKYFVPASNTKIPTLYAGLKYLGDSLVGLQYAELDTLLFITATADPTLLHRDYKTHPAFEFLKTRNKKLAYVMPAWQSNVYGMGWSWDDYDASYMPERNELPIYGNIVNFRLAKEGGKTVVKSDINYYRYAINERVDSITNNILIGRRRFDNIFDVYQSTRAFNGAQIPFRTFENSRLLEDTLKKAWLTNVHPPTNLRYKAVYSQPTDSMLKPMMHRSDNFFAEQTLLMASNEFLGVMSEAKIIDTILKTHFIDLPQKPRWVDGSGLSRYNLFTPQSFITILNKIKDEYGMDRIKEIFPTGNEGTITNYYKDASGAIYAKTGTLSGVVAFSGYLYTKKNKLLLFSVLVNNHQASATAVRRAVEKFILNLRNNY